jgi:hypothetical protein
MAGAGPGYADGFLAGGGGVLVAAVLADLALLYPQGNAAFVAEVRRTIDPDYAWNPYPYWRYTEPLARTLLEEREDAEGLATLAEYRRTHGRPEPPSEIIESGKLCQDNRDEGVAAVSVDLTHRRSESCPGVSGGLRRDSRYWFWNACIASG